jgi:hypothetical protein
MTAKARTVADFRENFDKDVIIPRKIQAALDAMLKEGAENWEYDADFVKRAGVSQSDMGRYRAQFEKHVILTANVNKRGPRKVWFASAKVAAKLRGNDNG